jgi:hypothetical protein
MEDKLEKRVNSIFKEFVDVHNKGNFRKEYLPEDTKDYVFDSNYGAKFVKVSGNDEDTFISLGDSKDRPSAYGHNQIHDLLRKLCPEKEIRDVYAGGWLSIYPSEEMGIFYGRSKGYRVSFTREQLLPVAKAIYEKGRGQIKRIAFAPDDYGNLLENFKYNEIEDPLLRLLKEKRADEATDFNIAVAYYSLVNYALIDLEKEFGGPDGY